MPSLIFSLSLKELLGAVREAWAAWTSAWRSARPERTTTRDEHECPLVARRDNAEFARSEESETRTVSSTRWRGPRVKTLVDADTAAEAVALVRACAGAGDTDELLSSMLRLFLLFPPSERQLRRMTRAAELGGGGGLDDFCACTAVMGMLAASDDLKRFGAPPPLARARSF